MKLHRYILVFVFAALGLGHAAETTFEGDIRPVLEKHCFNCHGPKKAKADVNLSLFTDGASMQRDPDLWLKVMSQLRERIMPPKGKPQPSFDERERVVQWIEQTLDNLDASQIARDPGRKVIHRLNRLEYNNTISDLLGVDTNPADKFPADGGGGGGFDNNADTLFIPPILMEKYLTAADEILALANLKTLFPFRPGVFTSDRSAARKNLEIFLPRAFRRPVTREDIDPLVALFDRSQQTGAIYEDALKMAIKAVLVSPNFLFRVEMEPGSEEPYPLKDYELATRLSYFLWSSMPDEKLFKLAGEKRLRQPKILEAQVRRMLQDAKAGSLAENFTGQWLGVRRLETTVQPDPNRFPSYTPALRKAMQTEPSEFFLSLLREDTSLLKLLDADYTFANEDLAKHYGITGVVGNKMQRVSLNDANRGGVLAMAGVLTLTSYPLRTSPVLRGRWVLDEILGTPPPPPPPLVPSLPPDDKSKEGLTLRQQLEKHRSKAECVACHQRMDPLGFGLENFDAIGRWRTELGGEPVDANGVLTTGEKFQGPAELKKILLSKKETFIRNVTERMLAYALGRGLEFRDRPAVKQIMAALAQDDYLSSTLILEIAKSYPFQYRRGSQTETKP
ncbi:MAG: DUF1592 domain-containing protein [Verrucomicrobiota bacterium]